MFNLLKKTRIFSKFETYKISAKAPPTLKDDFVRNVRNSWMVYYRFQKNITSLLKIIHSWLVL